MFNDNVGADWCSRIGKIVDRGHSGPSLADALALNNAFKYKTFDQKHSMRLAEKQYLLAEKRYTAATENDQDRMRHERDRLQLEIRERQAYVPGGAGRRGAMGCTRFGASLSNI